MEINRLLSSSVRLDCGSGQLAPLLLWRTCFRQVLGPLFIFSGEFLFFSFYWERVWGWCLMPLGKTRFCDSTVPGPWFFTQASVDWFGWPPLSGLS